MGYPTTKFFDLNFIRRTRENLEKEGEFEHDFTFLINTLVGLLILPNEKLKKGRFMRYNPFKKKICEVPKLNRMFNKRKVTICQEGTKEIYKVSIWQNNGIEKDISKVPVYEVLSKIRNSIAHFGIEPTRVGDKWDGVILRNIHNGNLTFEVYLTQLELKELAIYISDKYLTS